MVVIIMNSIIEKIYNDNSLNFKIINEIAEYLIVKYNDEPSFTLACLKNGLDRGQSEELFMIYSDITEEIPSGKNDLVNKKLLLEKTKEKFPMLEDDFKIIKIIESYINCYFLMKDK
jgi:hypothetical protein